MKFVHSFHPAHQLPLDPPTGWFYPASNSGSIEENVNNFCGAAQILCRPNFNPGAVVGKKRETGDGTPGGTNPPAPTLLGQNINVLSLFNVDNNLICILALDVEVSSGQGWLSHNCT